MQFKAALLVVASATSVLAHFIISNCEQNHAPNFQDILQGKTSTCDDRVTPLNGDVCKSKPYFQNFCPDSEEHKLFNFCELRPAGSNCPTAYHMKPRDDCGLIARNNGKLPADGTVYAHLVDADRNDDKVGTCYYKQDNGAITCADHVTHCQQFIKCELDLAYQHKC